VVDVLEAHLWGVHVLICPLPGMGWCWCPVSGPSGGHRTRRELAGRSVVDLLEGQLAPATQTDRRPQPDVRPPASPRSPHTAPPHPSTQPSETPHYGHGSTPARTAHAATLQRRLRDIASTIPCPDGNSTPIAHTPASNSSSPIPRAQMPPRATTPYHSSAPVPIRASFSPKTLSEGTLL
jgi:hypothetical protein